jgi:redox-sensitive bicupin YhaK (pirin superfamily)
MDRPVDRIEMPLERGASEQVQRKRLLLHASDDARKSPFLHLSEDWFAAPGGFETHPLRGMQTVTLVLDGALHHRDHTGADGVLRPGDVQWMTAGRGVLHSEMPYGRETAKMIPARYVDQPVASVPIRRLPGIEIRIYAGRSGEVSKEHGSFWPMMLLDIRIAAGHRLEQELPSDYRAFLYLLEGEAAIGADMRPLRASQVAWFEASGGAEGMDTIAIAARTPLRCLLFAGAPIDEPVAAYGPFVMNTAEEIRQAFADYYAGRLTG